MNNTEFKTLMETISELDRKNLNAAGYEIIEELEANNYNFVLTKMTAMETQMMGVEYQLGFSKDDTSFTDYEQHSQKFTKPGEKFGLNGLSQALPTIKQWTIDYGPILLSSSDERKNKLYSKIFKRANFEVQDNEIMGQHFIIIS